MLSGAGRWIGAGLWGVRDVGFRAGWVVGWRWWWWWWLRRVCFGGGVSGFWGEKEGGGGIPEGVGCGD